MARMNAPSVVTQRRPENRISQHPDRAGHPDDERDHDIGPDRARFTSSVDAIPPSSPTAVPTSIALANSHARGSGITLRR